MGQEGNWLNCFQFSELNQKYLKKAQLEGIFCCDCYRVRIPRGYICTCGLRIFTIMLKSYCLKWSNWYGFALMVQQSLCQISYHLLSHKWHKGGLKSCVMCSYVHRNGTMHSYFTQDNFILTGDLTVHRSSINGCGWVKHCNSLSKQFWFKSHLVTYTTI